MGDNIFRGIFLSKEDTYFGELSLISLFTSSKNISYAIYRLVL